MESLTSLTSLAGFTHANHGNLVTVGPAQRRWPWWAMFSRMEEPTYRIKATSPIVAVLGRRRGRGWLA